jgi:CHAT domain-containing protein
LGGLLSFFPIHASGDYDLARPTGNTCTVLDRVQSSYSPTLKALLHALRQARNFEPADADTPHKSLIITMENTPEFPDEKQLRKAREEQEAVAKHLGAAMSVKTLTNPTREQVLSEAADYKTLHFNCHGVSDRVDPSKSRLLLKDWKRNPLTFRDISHLHLERCRLVYLSACETARNDDIRLSDEGIHLAAGFQMAGVPSVIGSLWEIYEDDSLKMAEMMYSYLVNERGGVVFERLADAVHEAVRCLKDGGKRPLDWGSYILYGV